MFKVRVVMQLRAVVDASLAVGATRARNAKIAELAALLSGAPPSEVRVVVSWLSGELTQFHSPSL